MEELFKEHDLLMLIADGITLISRPKNRETLFFDKRAMEVGSRAYHLYVTSDEDINEGDWYAYKDGFLDGTVKTQEEFDTANWNVKQCEPNETAYTKRAQKGKNTNNGLVGCKKIIATTDPTLTTDIHGVGENCDSFRFLHQITRSFTEEFVNNPVDKVLVEHERDYSNRSCATCNMNLHPGCASKAGDESHGDYWISCLDDESDSELYKVKTTNNEVYLKIK